MVYLQPPVADLISRFICHPLGVQRGLTCTWPLKISMTLGLVTIQTGSTTAKWQNRLSRATEQGRKSWRSCRAKPRITTLDILFGPLPWDLACCHTGCLLFTEGMDTRMGQKAVCGAKGGIMDRTKS